MHKKIFLFFILVILIFSLASCKTAEEGNLPPEPMKPGEEQAASAPVGQVYKAAEFLDADQDVWAADPTSYFQIKPEEKVVFMIGEDEKMIELTAQNDQYIYNTFLYAEDPAPGETVDLENLWKEKSFTDYSDGERIGSSNWLRGDSPIIAQYPLSRLPARKRFFLTYGCSETEPKEYDLNERYVWDDAKDCHGEDGTEGKWMAHLLEVSVIDDMDSNKEMCEKCGLQWIGEVDGYCCGDDIKEAYITEGDKSNCCQYSFYKINPADAKCLPQEPCTDPQDAVSCKAEVEAKMKAEDAAISAIDWEARCLGAGGADIPSEGEAEGEGEEECAGVGEKGSEIFTTYLKCCSGLKQVSQLGFSVADICYYPAIAGGWEVGTCVDCGDGSCDEHETVCNCAEDCVDKEKSDYNAVEEFCAADTDHCKGNFIEPKIKKLCEMCVEVGEGAECQDQCTEAETKCDDNNINDVLVCKTNDNGCTSWVKQETCPDAKCYLRGDGNHGCCTNDCTPYEWKCKDDVTKDNCIYADPDPCLDYRPGKCGTGQKCEKGKCVVPTPIIPATGLVAYYPFDGDANDVSGKENDGTNSGATFVTGKKNKALNFDGTDSVGVDIEELYNAHYTVAMWIKPRTLTSSSLFSSAESNYPTLKFIHAGTNKPIIMCGLEKYRYGFQWTQDDLNKWHHIAFKVYGPNTNYMWIYVDGENTKGTPGNNAGYLYSFTSPMNIGHGFDGLIDEVRVYGRELTDAEVKQLYDAG